MNIKMKKTLRITAAILIVAIVLIGIGYETINVINNLEFNHTPALKLIITTNLSEVDTPQMSNITFEQTTIPFMYKKGHSAVSFPDISVNAKTNNIEQGPISYWASTSLTEDEGTYELLVIFMKDKEPKTGDLLFLPVRITNLRGDIIYKSTAFYLWE